MEKRIFSPPLASPVAPSPLKNSVETMSMIACAEAPRVIWSRRKSQLWFFTVPNDLVTKEYITFENQKHLIPTAKIKAYRKIIEAKHLRQVYSDSLLKNDVGKKLLMKEMSSFSSGANEFCSAVIQKYIDPLFSCDVVVLSGCGPEHFIAPYNENSGVNTDPSSVCFVRALGSPRKFRIRDSKTRAKVFDVWARHGDVFVMQNMHANELRELTQQAESRIKPFGMQESKWHWEVCGAKVNKKSRKRSLDDQ